MSEYMNPLDAATARIRESDVRIGAVHWTIPVIYRDGGMISPQSKIALHIFSHNYNSKILAHVYGRNVDAMATAAIDEAHRRLSAAPLPTIDEPTPGDPLSVAAAIVEGMGGDAP